MNDFVTYIYTKTDNKIQYQKCTVISSKKPPTELLKLAEAFKGVFVTKNIFEGAVKRLWSHKEFQEDTFEKMLWSKLKGYKGDQQAIFNFCAYMLEAIDKGFMPNLGHGQQQLLALKYIDAAIKLDKKDIAKQGVVILSKIIKEIDKANKQLTTLFDESQKIDLDYYPEEYVQRVKTGTFKDWLMSLAQQVYEKEELEQLITYCQDKSKVGSASEDVQVLFKMVKGKENELELKARIGLLMYAQKGGSLAKVEFKEIVDLISKIYKISADQNDVLSLHEGIKNKNKKLEYYDKNTGTWTFKNVADALLRKSYNLLIDIWLEAQVLDKNTNYVTYLNEALDIIENKYFDLPKGKKPYIKAKIALSLYQETSDKKAYAVVDQYLPDNLPELENYGYENKYNLLEDPDEYYLVINKYLLYGDIYKTIKQYKHAIAVYDSITGVVDSDIKKAILLSRTEAELALFLEEIDDASESHIDERIKYFNVLISDLEQKFPKELERLFYLRTSLEKVKIKRDIKNRIKPNLKPLIVQYKKVIDFSTYELKIEIRKHPERFRYNVLCDLIDINKYKLDYYPDEDAAAIEANSRHIFEKILYPEIFKVLEDKGLDNVKQLSDIEKRIMYIAAEMLDKKLKVNGKELPAKIAIYETLARIYKPSKIVAISKANKKDLKIYFDALLGLVYGYYDLNNFQKSLENINTIEKWFQINSNDKFMNKYYKKALFQKAEVLYKQEEIEKFSKIITEQLLSLLDTADEYFMYYELLLRMYEAKDDLDAAVKFISIINKKESTADQKLKHLDKLSAKQKETIGLAAEVTKAALLKKMLAEIDNEESKKEKISLIKEKLYGTAEGKVTDAGLLSILKQRITTVDLIKENKDLVKRIYAKVLLMAADFEEGRDDIYEKELEALIADEELGDSFENVLIDRLDLDYIWQQVEKDEPEDYQKAHALTKEYITARIDDKNKINDPEYILKLAGTIKDDSLIEAYNAYLVCLSNIPEYYQNAVDILKKIRSGIAVSNYRNKVNKLTKKANETLAELYAYKLKNYKEALKVVKDIKEIKAHYDGQTSILPPNIYAIKIYCQNKLGQKNDDDVWPMYQNYLLLTPEKLKELNLSSKKVLIPVINILIFDIENKVDGGYLPVQITEYIEKFRTKFNIPKKYQPFISKQLVLFEGKAFFNENNYVKVTEHIEQLLPSENVSDSLVYKNREKKIPPFNYLYINVKQLEIDILMQQGKVDQAIVLIDKLIDQELADLSIIKNKQDINEFKYYLNLRKAGIYIDQDKYETVESVLKEAEKYAAPANIKYLQQRMVDLAWKRGDIDKLKDLAFSKDLKSIPKASALIKLARLSIAKEYFKAKTKGADKLSLDELLAELAAIKLDKSKDAQVIAVEILLLKKEKDVADGELLPAVDKLRQAVKLVKNINDAKLKRIFGDIINGDLMNLYNMLRDWQKLDKLTTKVIAEKAVFNIEDGLDDEKLYFGTIVTQLDSLLTRGKYEEFTKLIINYESKLNKLAADNKDNIIKAHIIKAQREIAVLKYRFSIQTYRPKAEISANRKALIAIAKNMISREDKEFNLKVTENLYRDADVFKRKGLQGGVIEQLIKVEGKSNRYFYYTIDEEKILFLKGRSSDYRKEWQKALKAHTDYKKARVWQSIYFGGAESAYKKAFQAAINLEEQKEVLDGWLELYMDRKNFITAEAAVNLMYFNKQAAKSSALIEAIKKYKINLKQKMPEYKYSDLELGYAYYKLIKCTISNDRYIEYIDRLTNKQRFDKYLESLVYPTEPIVLILEELIEKNIRRQYLETILSKWLDK